MWGAVRSLCQPLKNDIAASLRLGCTPKSLKIPYNMAKMVENF
jgi:hypothetical protein